MGVCCSVRELRKDDVIGEKEKGRERGTRGMSGRRWVEAGQRIALRRVMARVKSMSKRIVWWVTRMWMVRRMNGRRTDCIYSFVLDDEEKASDRSGIISVC